MCSSRWAPTAKRSARRSWSSRDTRGPCRPDCPRVAILESIHGTGPGDRFARPEDRRRDGGDADDDRDPPGLGGPVRRYGPTVEVPRSAPGWPTSRSCSRRRPRSRSSTSSAIWFVLNGPQAIGTLLRSSPAADTTRRLPGTDRDADRSRPGGKDHGDVPGLPMTTKSTSPMSGGTTTSARSGTEGRSPMSRSRIRSRRVSRGSPARR